MKLKVFLILLFGLTSFNLPAQAADLFIRQKPSEDTRSAPIAPTPAPNANTTAEPEAPPIPELQEPAPQAEPLPETEDMNVIANKYFQNCMAKEHPLLKGENKQLLCSCTASKLPEVMSVEQMRTMQEPTKEGEFERSRMLMFVYTPCIEHPTRALILDQCMNNAQLKDKLKHQADTCNCLADGTADYMRENAPKAVENAMRRNNADIDPLRELLQSESFNVAQKSMLQTCLKRYELQ